MPNNIERINDAGEVIIEKLDLIVKGKTIDIRSFVIQTVIFEDIFSNMMTGHMVIQDAASFITQVSLSGLEVVSVSFRTPGYREQRIKKNFYISGISERSIIDKEQAYILNLISVEALKDNTTRVSKKFSGKTDVVVRKVFNEYIESDKTLVTERQSTDVAMVSPYWSPLKIINWIANRGYREVPNCLFYEGNKSFHFNTMDFLVKTEEVFGTYSYTPANTVEIYKNFASKYYNINRLGAIQFLDVFKGQDFGYYASKLITHDITLKQYNEYSQDFHKKKGQIENLEKTPSGQLFPSSLPRNVDSFRTLRTKQYGLFEEKMDPKYEDWVLQRNSLLFEMGNLRFTIEVPGRTDIEVGKVIECVIPKAMAKTDNLNIEDYLDPFLSGKYLITSIRHQFTLNKHEMMLELLKDSFKTSLG